LVDFYETIFEVLDAEDLNEVAPMAASERYHQLVVRHAV